MYLQSELIFYLSSCAFGNKNQSNKTIKLKNSVVEVTENAWLWIMMGQGGGVAEGSVSKTFSILGLAFPHIYGIPIKL